ncbi:MAG: DUF421 domain-containing protein [Allosphingosinicella sp.]
MDLLEMLLGPGGETELTALQMGARALVVYVVTLVIIRLGKKRFMGRATAFDVIVGIVLGSIASRAITGNAPMVPALTAVAVVMVLHWGFSAVAVRWEFFGKVIKGRSRLLVKDGKVDEHELCAAHMTIRDLLVAAREQGVTEISKVSEARLERDGSVSVSVVGKSAEPRIVDIKVESGVQTVRLELA